MESPTHDLKGLFDQLGLDSTQKAIDDFIASHSPLPDDKKLIDAEFWTPQQAGFLKEQLREDADWARVVDEVSGAVFEQEVTADLPAATQFLSPRLFLNTGATAAAVAYDCAGIYVETDF